MAILPVQGRVNSLGGGLGGGLDPHGIYRVPLPSYSGPALPSYSQTTPTPPIVSGIEPQAYEAILFGKDKPLFVGGKALIGGRINEGVFWSGTQAAPRASFIAVHAEAANRAVLADDTREITDARLRGKSVAYDGGGNLLDADLAGGSVEFRAGYIDQLPFQDSIDRYGSGAIAYRAGIISCWRNIPIAAFGGIIPMPSIEVSDSSFGDPDDGITRKDALEVLLRYSRLDDSEFEVSVPGSDPAWIVGSKMTFLEFLQSLRTLFVHWNITYTDKLRIIDPSNFNIDVEITRDNHLRESMRFNKLEPLQLTRKKNYNYIDIDRDFENNVVSAQEDIYPQPATSSIEETSVELPIVTTAAQATADINVSLFEELAAKSQMDATLMPVLFGAEAGDAARFADHDDINYIGRIIETQHDFESYQVDIRTIEVLNCLGAEADAFSEGVEFFTAEDVADRAYLNQLSTSIADTRLMTWSGFVKFDVLDGAYIFRIEQPVTGNDSSITIGEEADDFGIAARFIAGPAVTSQFYVETDFGVLVPGQWHHVFVSVDTNHGAGSKICNLLVDGVDVVDGAATVDADGAFDISVNGYHLWNPPKSFLNQYYCNVMVWFDQCIDPTVGNLAKFVDDDGNPVDPAEAIAEFGTPAILFTGGADEFVVNQGSGGAFTPSGTIDDAAGPP